MKQRSHSTLILAIIFAIIVIDQAVKIWVKTHFYLGEQVDITSWFKILFIENNGMAFGLEMGSKMFLTWFRIIAVIVFSFYLIRIRHRTDLSRGYVACLAMITAGAAANVIDCIAYGVIFNAPHMPHVAQLFPPDGGYAPLFHGRVVDMLYFPLFEWDWPDWMPWIAGQHAIFFQPVFNIADAALTTSVATLIIFYRNQLANESQKPDTPTPSDGASTQP